MRQLRHNITFLILYFFTLFVLLYGGYVFGFELISLFVVLLISVMVIIDLLTPKTKFWTRNVLWLLAYGFYLVWLLLQTGFAVADSFQSVYRIFTEIFLLSVGLNISRRISEFVDQTQLVLQEVTFAQVKPPKQLVELMVPFEVEINRSLRYERPLSLIVIDVIPKLEIENGTSHLSVLQNEMVENYFNARVGHEIQKLTRNTDLVAATEAVGNFFILCPETTKRSGSFLAERIQMMVEERFEAVMHWGIAEIDSGCTSFQNLCSQAELEMQNRTNNPQVRFDSFAAEADFFEDEDELESEEL
jgi:prepilin signal peptidase PulO-like enzyme (type II secretory pathway)